MIVSTTILSRRLLDSTTPGEVVLSNNSFNKLSATDGGIIYDLSSNQTINILLVNNTIREVQVLKRGGIAYVNQPYLFMVNNVISSITAIVSGSVIYARSDKLLLINQHNKFENANFDTAFVFSPTNLKIEVFNLMDESLISLENYSDTLTSIPNLPNLTSYSLGQLRMTFTLVYAGASGVRTAIDESLNPGLILVFTHLNSNATPQVYPKSVCRGSVCTIVASTITLAGKAGDMYLVNATYESVAYALSQQFTITLRECIPGELNQTFTEQCVPCPQEKYSLQPNDPACSECPAGAKCLSGGNISIRKGYSRSPNVTSLTILPCKDDGRCLGGVNNSCIQGYAGPLCLQCDYEGEYIMSSKGRCEKCDVNASLYLWGLIYLLAGISYQIFLVVTSFKQNKEIHISLYTRGNVSKTDTPSLEAPSEQIRPAQWMVILTTFVQISSVFASFGIDTAFSIVNASQPVANPNQQAFLSFKCIFYSRVSSPFQEIQLEILLYVFSPVFKLAVVAIGEAIRCVIKNSENLKKFAVVRLGTAAVVLIFLEQPSIIGALSNYLSCDKLDPNVEDTFIKIPNSVQCFTPKYNRFRNIVVIPALAFWGFVVPLTIFMILFKKRKDLVRSEALCVVFGQLYSGYTERAFYWGILIIVLKMLMFTLNSVLTVHDTTKSVIFLCIVQIYYELLNRMTPYNDKILLRAEKFCIFAYRINLISILVKLPYQNQGLSTACDMIGLTTSVLVGAFILFHVTKLYLGTAKKFVKTLQERREDQKTLAALKEYHIGKGEIQFERRRRRTGIYLEPFSQ